MSIAHATPPPRKDRKAARAKPRTAATAKPPVELDERGKLLWALLIAARKANPKRMTETEVEDLIDSMRDR